MDFVNLYCTLINPIVGWIGLSIPASVIDYLTIGGIVVAAHLRTIRAFPDVRNRMIFPWAKPDLPSYIRWPLGIPLLPVTFGLFYVVLAISLMLLFLSDRLLGEGQGSTNAERKDIFKTIAAASAFLMALSLPFILMASDAPSSG